MFKFIERDNYLNKLKKMSNEELLKEYVRVRSTGSIFCALGNVKNKDVDNWVACEDFLTKVKKVDFDILNEYAVASIALNSGKINLEKETELKKQQSIAKNKLLESM